MAVLHARVPQGGNDGDHGPELVRLTLDLVNDFKHIRFLLKDFRQGDHLLQGSCVGALNFIRVNAVERIVRPALEPRDPLTALEPHPGVGLQLTGHVVHLLVVHHLIPKEALLLVEVRSLVLQVFSCLLQDLRLHRDLSNLPEVRMFAEGGDGPLQPVHLTAKLFLLQQHDFVEPRVLRLEGLVHGLHDPLQLLGPPKGLPLGLEIVVCQAILEHLQNVVIREHLLDGCLQLNDLVGDLADVILEAVQQLYPCGLLLALRGDADELFTDLV
mmetsp:Transcript_29150/g.52411  ORF Transcript_29150/g.52411 Transcript_29150/m.52411 type:complete len:271 (+) Transcript_29150:925-1737(+)